MGRKAETPDDFRVIVRPRQWGNYGSIRIYSHPANKDEADRRSEESKRLCEEIAADVKRHVDGIDSVIIDWSQTYACEHCGSSWTEADTRYNGGCCDEDEAANPDNLSPAAVVQPPHPSHDGQAQSASPNGDDAREFGGWAG